MSEEHKPATVKQYMIGKIRRPKIKYKFEACCTVNTSEIGIRGFCSGGWAYIYILIYTYYIIYTRYIMCIKKWYIYIYARYTIDICYIL